MIEILTSPEAWMSLLTLTFLEIVLGVDNIIFITISANKLPEEERGKATNIGLVLAMAMRLLLLLGISYLIAMSTPWIEFHTDFISGGFTGQSIILVIGGIFLLYKSTSEIHHKLEGDNNEEQNASGKKKVSMTNVIIQIAVINIVFSFDSILTAVGMTNGVIGAMPIMVTAIVLSVIIMMLFAQPVGRFVNNNPTIQMLGLSFLILIGFMLIAEGAHLAHFTVGGQTVGVIPKGYLYFAISFSLLVEFFNLKLRKKKPIQLHGIGEEAVGDGVLPRASHD